jgi:kynurenine aminotransferase
MTSLDSEIARQTLVVGSVGKDFYATAWRIGFLIGNKDLVQYVCSAHTPICFVSPGPLQEAAAVGYETASKCGFWDQSKLEMLRRMNEFNKTWDELGLTVHSLSLIISFLHISVLF